MIEARGTDGAVIVDGEWVTVRRRGLVAIGVHHGRGEMRLHVSQIAGVDFKPTGMTRGHLTLIVPGGGGGKATRGTLRDAYSVSFLRGGDDFRAVRDAIEAAIAARR